MMSEKRFTVKSIKNNHYQIAENDLKMLSNEVVDYMNLSSDAIGSLQKKVVEQQDTIDHLKQELGEYKENWDDLVELATKTSLRNVELDEQIGRLQREKLGGNY